MAPFRGVQQCQISVVGAHLHAVQREQSCILQGSPPPHCRVHLPFKCESNPQGPGSPWIKCLDDRTRPSHRPSLAGGTEMACLLQGLGGLCPLRLAGLQTPNLALSPGPFPPGTPPNSSSHPNCLGLPVTHPAVPSLGCRCCGCGPGWLSDRDHGLLDVRVQPGGRGQQPGAVHLPDVRKGPEGGPEPQAGGPLAARPPPQGPSISLGRVASFKSLFS